MRLQKLTNYCILQQHCIMASLITGNPTVSSKDIPVYSPVRGTHRWPMYSPHKRSIMRNWFLVMTLSCLMPVCWYLSSDYYYLPDTIISGCRSMCSWNHLLNKNIRSHPRMHILNTIMCHDVCRLTRVMANIISCNSRENMTMYIVSYRSTYI